jgi:uncharacterized protein (DUF2147 family)
MLLSKVINSRGGAPRKACVSQSLLPLTLTLTLLPGVLPVFATQAESPVGRWQMIDDETNEPRGIVEVTEVKGELQGRFVQAYPRPGEVPNAVCVKCEGERKDKPIVGMIILWGLKASGSNWSGGHILDPTKGKVYQATLSLADGGSKIRVRGFIGVALLGRTQTWIRLQ